MSLTTKVRLSIRLRIVLASSMAFIALSALALYAFQTERSDIKRANRLLQAETESLLKNIKEHPLTDKAHLASLLENHFKSTEIIYESWPDEEPFRNAQGFKISDITQRLFSPPEVGGQRQFTLELGEHDYRASWSRFEVPQTHSAYNILLFVQITERDVIAFIKHFGAIGGSVLLVAILGSFLLVNWGLKPIKQFTHDLEHHIEPQLFNNTFTPLSQTKYSQELAPFVSTFNKLFIRLADLIHRQKKFTADASHELKTPIAILKSSLELASLKSRSTEYYEQLTQQCLRETLRLEQLSAQLLDTARLSTPPPSIQHGPIALDELIREQVLSSAPLAKERHQTLIEQLEPCTIVGSAFEIKQLIANLLENAIHHGPDSAPITLALTQTPPRLIIHDEGGNIPKEKQTKLFDRFYRVDAARSRNAGGSGLGLAIAQEIAHRHKAQIHITSSPAKGTQAHVEF